MPTILKTKSIYYNDVNLINNKIGKIVNRKNVPREINRLVISPMSALVGKTFAIEASKLGFTVCLHRFCKPEEELDIYLSIEEKYRKNIYCSIGLNNDINRYNLLVDNGCRKFVLDIALGFHPNISMYLNQLNKYHRVNKIESIILGNIHSKEGFNYLRQAAKNSDIPEVIIRCGIGNGIACKSSDTVGINRGNITEIMECFEEQNKSIMNTSSWVCADGSLSKGANFCKSFAAGSSFAMAGGFWMKSIEAESNLNGDYSYWGGASDKQQFITNGSKIKHSEGKEIYNFNKKEDLKPLKEILEELWGNISSFVSYSGYKTLTECIGNGVFEIKENSLPPKNRF